MSSQLVLITRAVYDLLNAAKPGGVFIHRDRNIPVNADELPALVVYFQADTPGPNEEVFAGGAQQRVCSVRVEIRTLAPGNPPAPWEEATDDLRVLVIQTLSQDPELGGLADMMVRREVAVDGAELDRAFAACALDFDYHYFFRP